MRIQYVGMFDEVIVPELLDEHGYPRSVRQGETVDVPAELAARLLEQEDNWRKAPAAAGRKAEAGAAGSAAPGE